MPEISVQEDANLLHAVYAGLLVSAVEAGQSLGAIKRSITEGWNNGSIPRLVLNGRSERGDIQLYRLHGVVPDDFLGTSDNENENTCGLVVLASLGQGSGEVVSDSPWLYDLPTEPDIDNPEAFYIEAITLPAWPDDERYELPEVRLSLESMQVAFDEAQQPHDSSQ